MDKDFLARNKDVLLAEECAALDLIKAQIATLTPEQLQAEVSGVWKDISTMLGVGSACLGNCGDCDCDECRRDRGGSDE